MKKIFILLALTVVLFGQAYENKDLIKLNGLIVSKETNKPINGIRKLYRGTGGTADGNTIQGWENKRYMEYLSQDR